MAFFQPPHLSQPEHPQITALKMGWCKLGPAGARAVSDLLMFNQSLTALDLRGNGLGNDGAIILARGLKVGGWGWHGDSAFFRGSQV